MRSQNDRLLLHHGRRPYMALGVVLTFSRSRRSRCMRDKKWILGIGHRTSIAPTLVVAAQQQSLRIS